MPVITRKPGESITIGEHIVVTVVCVKGSRTTFYIDAPPDMPIDRGEVDTPPTVVDICEEQRVH